MFCYFYLIFLEVTLLVQFYVSFGGMQGAHILKNSMCLDNEMSDQAGCCPFPTGIIRVAGVGLKEAFPSSYFAGRIPPSAQVQGWL